MAINRNPQEANSGSVAVSKLSGVRQTHINAPASGVAKKKNTLVDISRRHHLLCQINDCMATVCDFVLSSCVDSSTWTEREFESTQAAIDSSLAEIAKYCQELPYFEANEMLPFGLESDDQRPFSEVYPVSVITLESLGLSRGLRIRPTYRDIVRPVEQSLFDELQESELHLEQPDHIKVASERFYYVKSIAEDFVVAMGKLVVLNLEQGKPCLSPGVSSAENLVDQLNEAVGDNSYFSISDINLLAGGEANTNQFIANAKAVMPDVERLRLAQDAADKISHELSGIVELMYRLDMR